MSKQLIMLFINKELEIKSRYSLPSKNARKWFWKDDCNSIGFLYAITEMEALDRLREAFNEAGSITWISEKEFNSNPL
ncbi:hypothetical protein [Pedobacter suwonensis]|uniref:hypothetical protein n=1 Tax=Pedobacter suwonensis TaxID=332999 RepID=UPI0011A7A6FC|nr:hypothetical protein [Pedobacter suwonensis]